MNRIIKAIKDPYWALSVILRFISKCIKDDKTYIKWEYYLGMHKKLHLEQPRTYNEKLQWFKIHDIHPEYVRMVDKAMAKDYVREVLGNSVNVIKTLGIWNSFDEIDFESLPSSFVLKTTHDSGGIVVVPDKTKLNKKKARRKLNKSLQHDYYWVHREYPYKYIKPRILAEEYMVDESGTELKDYKFFCFNGEPKMLFVATGRPYDTRFDFYDTEWNHLPFKQGHPWATKEIKKPAGFEKMLDIASKLSKGFPHVRVDLYDINGEIYFGEMTFFHFSGNVPFEPEEWDYKIGEWLRLPKE